MLPIALFRKFSPRSSFLDSVEWGIRVPGHHFSRKVIRVAALRLAPESIRVARGPQEGRRRRFNPVPGHHENLAGA